MEVENNHVILKEKLEFSDILKEALKVPHKSINFIVFAAFTSLPLFLFMLIYEVIFQRALIEASNILEPPYGYFYYTWRVPFYVSDRWTKDFALKLVQLGLLYLVPLFISEVVVTVGLASKIYTGERPMTLKEMMIELKKRARWEGPFITSVYVLSLSTCTLVGLIWSVTNYYFISRNTFYGYFFVVFFAAAFMALLKKYLEWSAVWNMGVVVSVLEGLNGTQALMLSAYFSRGNERRRGLLLMLVFFVWGFGLKVAMPLYRLL